MQDDKVTKMAEALLSGGKMLSLHCAKCRGPLFEKDGKITCAVCGENFADVRKAEAVKPVAAKDVQEILAEKLQELAAQLRNETDPHKISEILVLMKSILEALEKLGAK
ncbi:MAG: hypothetical protein MUO36_02015 [Candidatus Hadarchaeum sp.]|nr:hypothetical protein [Candidatus Hadarchaeum sp.]